MNQIQLYLNDELVDLSDDSPIVLTYQINNLAEVKNQQGNTSNQFKLPLTQRNRRVLGFPDEVAFTDDKPYQQYAAKVIQDGLEIMPYGVCELNGIDQDTAAITILSGNVDFFDAIDAKLYDMGDSANIITKQGTTLPWATYNHDWTVANVVSSQNNTEGWIWPVVDYGTIPADITGTPVINVRYLRPGFFLKTAIDLIVASAGYQIDPDSFLLKDELYPKLIVQFANDSFDHGTDYQNAPDAQGIDVALNQNFSADHPNAHNPDGYIHWPLIYNNKSGRFLAGYVYNTPETISVTTTVNIPEFYLHGRVTDNPSSVEMAIILSNLADGTQSVLTSHIFDFSAGYSEEHHTGSGPNKQSDTTIINTVISIETEVPAGHQLAVRYAFQGNTPANFVMKSGARWTVKTNDPKVQYGQNIQCERIFPDISMKDLLKDTLQRFGIICQTNNTTRTIRLASFRDIVNNIPNAKDWSSKCLNQGKAISFQLGGYAQVNYMKYKQDDAILPATLGQSQINVSDATLPATADLFESQFAPTLYRPYINSTIAQILKVDTVSDPTSTDFSTSTQPRILINDVLNLSDINRAVRFTDGNAANDVIVNSRISIPYFDKTNGRYSLTFDYLRQNYYPELQKILTQSKKVVRYFILTPRDILELDLLIPVYLQQDGTYYYINKIDSWRKGQPTKVELVKLG